MLLISFGFRESFCLTNTIIGVNYFVLGPDYISGTRGHRALPKESLQPPRKKSKKKTRNERKPKEKKRKRK